MAALPRPTAGVPTRQARRHRRGPTTGRTRCHQVLHAPRKDTKKALRAEIDEAEWSKLYSTRSLPFEAPKKGKIAVKGINHCGDEVLKVFRAP